MNRYPITAILTNGEALGTEMPLAPALHQAELSTLLRTFSLEERVPLRPSSQSTY
jgi:hypothetical protein